MTAAQNARAWESRVLSDLRDSAYPRAIALHAVYRVNGSMAGSIHVARDDLVIDDVMVNLNSPRIVSRQVFPALTVAAAPDHGLRATQPIHANAPLFSVVAKPNSMQSTGSKDAITPQTSSSV